MYILYYIRHYSPFFSSSDEVRTTKQKWHVICEYGGWTLWIHSKVRSTKRPGPGPVCFLVLNNLERGLASPLVVVVSDLVISWFKELDVRRRQRQSESDRLSFYYYYYYFGTFFSVRSIMRGSIDLGVRSFVNLLSASFVFDLLWGIIISATRPQRSSTSLLPQAHRQAKKG